IHPSGRLPRTVCPIPTVGHAREDAPRFVTAVPPNIVFPVADARPKLTSSRTRRPASRSHSLSRVDQWTVASQPPEGLMHELCYPGFGDFDDGRYFSVREVIVVVQADDQFFSFWKQSHGLRKQQVELLSLDFASCRLFGVSRFRIAVLEPFVVCVGNRHAPECRQRAGRLELLAAKAGCDAQFVLGCFAAQGHRQFVLLGNDLLRCRALATAERVESAERVEDRASNPGNRKRREGDAKRGVET